MLLLQVKANKRYAGSSNWTVQVLLLLFAFVTIFAQICCSKTFVPCIGV